MKVSTTEIVVYVCAAAIVLIVAVNNAFSTDFVNLVSSISGALVLLGFVASAIALLWRRITIRKNRSIYGDKAEAIEKSVNDTLIYVWKGFVLLWFLFVVIGLLESLKQYL